MRTGHAVIGANYGDEGKGLMTDFLASKSPGDTLVVRFNGGAQAGHTVQTTDGRRHVFSHFGAGTFAECPSHLSQFFIVNPLLFAKEHKQLLTLGANPVVSMDYRAFVTTPIDMFINQQAEIRRGNARFGSCGVGINETVTRSLRAPEFQLRVADLQNPKRVKEKMLQLMQVWLPERLLEYKMDINSEATAKFIASADALADRFIIDVEGMLNVSVVTFEFPKQERIIFEGAQGLMLDENRIDLYPHLTRSNTGLTNVVFLATRYGIDKLDVTYVTRTYLTRHGAGPLQGECDFSFKDDTNVPNQFQGTLRFAPLDWSQVSESIALDLAPAKRAYPQICAGLAVTCADQMPIQCGESFPVPLSYVSYGPTRSSIVSMSSANRIQTNRLRSGFDMMKSAIKIQKAHERKPVHLEQDADSTAHFSQALPS